jgi:hypothetical protein
MNKSKQIESLWDTFQAAIDAAYKDATKDWNDDPRYCLRNYASNVGWHDEMQLLIDKETEEERKHRKARPYVVGEGNKFYVSAINAAKLLLMTGAADVVSKDTKNASLSSIPPAPFRWLMIRRTIAEAELLGWIVRDYLTVEWCEQVKAIDYTKLHN